jgi:hypothetical protein
MQCIQETVYTHTHTKQTPRDPEAHVRMPSFYHKNKEQKHKRMLKKQGKNNMQDVQIPLQIQ